MTEINNCPFCSSDNIEVRADSHSVYIACNMCNALGSEAENEEEAIAKWNAVGGIHGDLRSYLEAYRQILQSCLLFMNRIGRAEKKDIPDYAKDFMVSVQAMLICYSDSSIVDAFVKYRKIAIQDELSAETRVFALFHFMNAVREKISLESLTMEQYKLLLFDL